jgi:hypothetical protein
MVTAVVIFILLTVVASLASWLFGQWLERRTGTSGIALAVAGGGTLLLIGIVAFVMIGTATWWRQLLPIEDFSLSEPSTGSLATSSAVPDKQREERAQKVAAIEQHFEQREYRQSIEVAHEYLADYPGDPEITALLARSQFAAQSAVIRPEWQETGCIASTYSPESAVWVLDNGCGRVVGVLFASCDDSLPCTDQNWSYQPAGILMTAANDRPVPVRLGKGGPLVAPIFTIRDPAGSQRQIRYLACEVTAPHVLELLRDSREELTEERLSSELRADACYARVLDWSRSGHRLGTSPDALLRNGID